MTIMHWGRGLLLWGLVAAALALLPAIVLGQLPVAWSTGFLGTLAALLSLSVAPIGLIVSGAGLVVLLVGLLRRAGR